MTAYQIAYNLAVAISNNDAIQSLAVELFGSPLKIFMDTSGTLNHLDLIDDNFATDAEKTVVMKSAVYPQFIISGTGESGGIVSDEEFEVMARLIIDASIAPDGTDIDTSKAMRDENGIFVSGRGKSLSELSYKIKKMIPTFLPGSNIQDIPTDYENGAFYPLQFSDFTLNYKSYQAFGDAFGR